MIAQPEVERLCGQFLVKHLAKVVDVGLDDVLSLVLTPSVRSLSFEKAQGLLNMLLTLALKYDYSGVDTVKFKSLWSRVVSLQHWVCGSRTEQSIVAYAQLKSILYLSWVYAKPIDTAIWMEVFTSMVEVLQWCR